MQNVTFTELPAVDDEWTDEGAEIFFDRLKTVMREQEIKITFTKKDGTERVMRCTLDPNKLPVHETNTDNPIDFPETKRKVSTETMAVFDLDVQGWRSFTKKSVKCVDFTTHRS
jgi:WYL_2, Sm-like SH3 beta-barrel fold